MRDAGVSTNAPERTGRNRQASTISARTPGMGDLEESVRTFLSNADDCYSEYENGYTDADATLRRLDSHIEDLRDSVED